MLSEDGAPRMWCKLDQSGCSQQCQRVLCLWTVGFLSFLDACVHSWGLTELCSLRILPCPQARPSGSWTSARTCTAVQPAVQAAGRDFVDTKIMQKEPLCKKIPAEVAMTMLLQSSETCCLVSLAAANCLCNTHDPHCWRNVLVKVLP